VCAGRPVPKNSQIKLKGLSLLANVWISESLLKNTNLDIVVANEFLPERVRFYQEMHPDSKMVCGDITDKDTYNEVIQTSKNESVDFIIATPPCQGFSSAGQQKEDDPRNSLIKYVVKAIKDLEPQHILIENVVGVLKAYNRCKTTNDNIMFPKILTVVLKMAQT
jgi:DNA (cytosine-5)-methyltransferase 1